MLQIKAYCSQCGKPVEVKFNGIRQNKVSLEGRDILYTRITVFNHKWCECGANLGYISTEVLDDATEEVNENG